MEEAKRYPISMWTKLRRVVNQIKIIPDEDKERFIDIVGNKVARYRNQGMHRRYKPEKLPAMLYKMHDIPNENYNTILYWDELKLALILEDIYKIMKPQWFSDDKEDLI